jgi:DNA-binding response OmpR family regulator
MSDADAAGPAVVIVEDSGPIQAVLQRMLSRNGFAPYAASDPAGAILLATRHDVRAFIVDLTFSGSQSGFGFIDWVRRQPRYRITPVTILTGLVSLSDEQEALVHRSEAYVFYKPGRLQVLIDHLLGLIDVPERPGH